MIHLKADNTIGGRHCSFLTSLWPYITQTQPNSIFDTCRMNVSSLNWLKLDYLADKILCYSFTNVTPQNQFYPNRMKNKEVQIFKILET